MINHSFAVMAYRDSPYLSLCLDSLFRQKVESAVFITTSTPSDYIFNIARQYGVEVFVNDDRKGISQDWNFSLRKAKTKYVTLAHQDDIYLPEYSIDSMRAAEKFNDTIVSFTNYRELNLDQEARKKLIIKIKEWILIGFMPFKNNIKRKFWKKMVLTFGSPIACPSVMYNLEQLIDFNFSTEYSISLDWEAWFRMAGFKGRFVYVPKVLLKHRIHLQSETTAGLEANIRQMEDLKMFKRIWPSTVAKFLAKLYSGSYKSNEGKIKSNIFVPKKM